MLNGNLFYHSYGMRQEKNLEKWQRFSLNASNLMIKTTLYSDTTAGV